MKADGTLIESSRKHMSQAKLERSKTLIMNSKLVSKLSGIAFKLTSKKTSVFETTNDNRALANENGVNSVFSPVNQTGTPNEMIKEGKLESDAELEETCKRLSHNPQQIEEEGESSPERLLGYDVVPIKIGKGLNIQEMVQVCHDGTDETKGEPTLTERIDLEIFKMENALKIGIDSMGILIFSFTQTNQKYQERLKKSRKRRSGCITQKIRKTKVMVMISAILIVLLWNLKGETLIPTRKKQRLI